MQVASCTCPWQIILTHAFGFKYVHTLKSKHTTQPFLTYRIGEISNIIIIKVRKLSLAMSYDTATDICIIRFKILLHVIIQRMVINESALCKQAFNYGKWSMLYYRPAETDAI